jgi:hypothetical protein
MLGFSEGHRASVRRTVVVQAAMGETGIGPRRSARRIESGRIRQARRARKQGLRIIACGVRAIPEGTAQAAGLPALGKAAGRVRMRA